jgi:hypothetical protein
MNIWSNLQADENCSTLLYIYSFKCTFLFPELLNTVELRLSGLTGTANHPDKKKIRITGIFFLKLGYVDSLKCKNFYKRLFWPTYLFTYQ